jgi:uncharacterized protein YpuA (DUF1002 family)
MKNNNIDYNHVRLRILPSQNNKLQVLKDNVKSEYNIAIFKNDIMRIALAQFLEKNSDITKFKETLEKHNYL